MSGDRVKGVPILTQSENWALSATDRLLAEQRLVPILTQSENWALSKGSKDQIQAIAKFQSSPSPKTGRYVLRKPESL